MQARSKGEGEVWARKHQMACRERAEVKRSQHGIRNHSCIAFWREGVTSSHGTQDGAREDQIRAALDY